MSFLKKPNKKVPSAVLNTRIRQDISDLLLHISSSTGINRRDLIEFALINHCLSYDVDFKSEGIDFKKYYEIVKLEKLRNIQGKFRNEQLSKILFLNRVRLDILKMISCNVTSKEIEKYLKLRRKEIDFYSENEHLKKEFDSYLEKNNLKRKQLEREIKEKIEFKTDTILDKIEEKTK